MKCPGEVFPPASHSTTQPKKHLTLKITSWLLQFCTDMVHRKLCREKEFVFFVLTLH